MWPIGWLFSCHCHFRLLKKSLGLTIFYANLMFIVCVDHRIWTMKNVLQFIWICRLHNFTSWLLPSTFSYLINSFILNSYFAGIQTNSFCWHRMNRTVWFKILRQLKQFCIAVVRPFCILVLYFSIQLLYFFVVIDSHLWQTTEPVADKNNQPCQGYRMVHWCAYIFCIFFFFLYLVLFL